MRASEPASTPVPAPPAVPTAVRAREEERAQGRLALWLVGWVLFLFLNPIYVYEPGEPQPRDLLMAVFLAFMVTGYGLRIPIYRDLYLVGYLFLIWVGVVNTIWWFIHPDRFLIMSILYYVYNFGIAVYVLSLARTYGATFFRATRLAMIAVLLAEAAYAAAMGAGGWRALGTFNNPNQLGYWSLLTVACLMALKDEARLTAVDLIAFAAAISLALLSMSRATLLGLLVLIATATVCQGFDRRWASVFAFMALALTAFAVFVLFSLDPARLDRLIEGMVPTDNLQRLTLASEADNATFAHRGYDRLWLYPDYLVLGAGEGGFDRFTLSLAGHLEIHSSLGTILFSYGIPGIVMFAVLLWIVFSRAPLRHLLYFTPIMIFNLAHQGLRFPLFWIFLGLVVAMARGEHRARPAARGRP